MPLILRVDADTKKATSKIKSASKSAAKSIKKLETDSVASTVRMRQSFEGLTGKIGALRNQLLVFAFATAGAVSIIKKTITAASDLEESINAVNVVFGKGGDIILDFGETAAEAVGLANAEFNQLATITGALLVGTGKSLNEVSDITIKLTKRAADMASVFNTDVKDALSAINQALRGETEAIRRYAGDVTDATLQTFALAQGIDQQVSSMTQQEKRLLRVDLILSQTSNTHGDFKKTSDTLANATRILGARMLDLASNIGTGLIPAATNAVAIIGTLIDTFEKFRELREKFPRFGGLISDEEIEKFKAAIPTLGGFATAMLNAAQAQAAFLKSGESKTKETDEFTLFQARLEQDIKALKVKELEIDVSETQLTLTLQALGVSRETFDLQQDLILLAQDKDLLEQASNTIITTRLKKVNEIFDLEVQARVNAVNAAEAADKLADNQQRAADAAGQFTQNLARALVSGQGIEKALLSAAISLGLSFLPGGSVFGGFFGHGGIAPGGGIPSIVGEGGGGAEIIQSATPIRVTPINQTTNNRTITMPVTIQVVQSIDEFTIQDQLIPLLNGLAEDGSRILSSEVI